MNDTAPPPPHSTLPAGILTHLKITGPGLLLESILFLLLALTYLNYPAYPGTELDPSWRQMLGFAQARGLQFGEDIIFTYGPLGFLLNPSNTGDLHTLHLVWQVGVASCFAALTLAFSRAYRGMARALVILFFFVVMGPSAEGLTWMMMFILVLTYGQKYGGRSGWPGVLLVGILALVSLQKFTFLMLSIGVIAIMSLQAIALGRHRTSWVIPLTYGGLFMTGWVACGQSVLGLPAYLATSWDLSRGYSMAMGLPPDGITLLVGLGSIIALSWFIGEKFVHRPRWVTDGAIVLMAAWGAFLAWKHGFVRADAHTQSHFQFQLFLVMALPVFLQPGSSSPKRSTIALTTVVLFCLIGLWRSDPYTNSTALMNANYRIRATIERIITKGRWISELTNHYTHVKNQSNLLGIEQIVGEHSVDILGNEQAYAIFNEFNYTPRPTFQSYLAYTQSLIEKNGRFYAQNTAPDFVLQKLQTIDFRLPALDDSQAALAIYQDYNLVASRKRFLVWQRRDATELRTPPELISESGMNWGTPVEVPDLNGDPVWCEIDVQLSLIGHLRNLLYRPDIINIHTADVNGFGMRYRFLPESGRAGFLIDPHFISNHDIIQYQRDQDLTVRLKTLSLETSTPGSADYRDNIKVRFYRVAPLTRNPTLGGGNREEIFRSFSHLPDGYDALYEIANLKEAGAEVVAAHPPSEIEFKRPAEASWVSGSFGFFQSAFAEGQITDGVKFVVEWVNRFGENRILFEQLLNPSQKDEDKLLQFFEVELPDESGLIRLSTTPGPLKDISFDWVYWRDITFSDESSH